MSIKLSLVSFLFLSVFTFSSNAQSVSLPQAALSSAPMGTVENNGTAIATLFFVETSGAPVPETASNEPNVSISINLQYVELTNEDIGLISGDLLNYFTPSYDVPNNIILLQQNNDIPGDWSGTVEFSIDVTKNSTQGESLNGFNATIASQDENTNAEGNASIYTYTDESVLQINTNDLYTFSVFPNPTKNFIQVTTENNPITKAAIFDLTGKLVYEKYFTNTANDLRLNISHLNSSVYILSLTTNTSTYNTRLIKE